MNIYARQSPDASGFTLVELLVSMFIFAMIVMLTVTFFTSGSRTTVQSSTRAEMQQEILNAQQLLASNAKEAWFIFPPGTTVTMNNGGTTRNPVTGQSSWVVGDFNNVTNAPVNHPILAMILPPEDSTAACSPTVTPPISAGCYQFRAYYPVERSTWVTATQDTSWRNPGEDSVNQNVWVMAEFRGTYNNGVGNPPVAVNSAATPPVANVPAGVANLLADYISPSIGPNSTRQYAMFSFPNPTGLASNASASRSTVEIRFAAERAVSGLDMRLPAENSEYEMSATTQNIGRQAQ